MAFTLPGQAPAAPPETPEAPPVQAEPEAPGGPTKAQDWGPATGNTQGMETYWATKAEAQPVATPGVAAPGAATAAQQQFGEAAAKSKGGGQSMAAAVLILVGGLCAVAGALQPWVTVDSSGLRNGSVDQFKGTIGWEGQFALILGILAVLVAVVWFAAGRDTRRLKGAVIDGVLLVGIGVYMLVTLQSQFTSGLISEAQVQGMAEAEARGLVTGWLSAGKLAITPEIGLYLVVAGGVLVLIGSFLAFLAKDSTRAESWSSSAPQQESGF